MTIEELGHIFPNLTKDTARITSQEDYRYNCIAWAGGDSKKWWEPSGKSYHFWLHHDLAYTMESYLKVFNILGFKEESDSSEPEKGFEKVALYVDPNGIPTHAARQLENGAWISKLGRLEDIEHTTLEVLEGEDYGKVKVILKRLRYDKSKEAM